MHTLKLYLIICALCAFSSIAYAQSISVSEQVKSINAKRQPKIDKLRQKIRNNRSSTRGPLQFKNDAKFVTLKTFEAGGKKGIKIRSRLSENGDMPYIYVQCNMKTTNIGYVFPATQETKDSLLSMYNKYIEWKEVVDKNNITSKEIKLPQSIKGCMLYKIDAFNIVVHRSCGAISPTMQVVEGHSVLYFNETKNMGGDLFSDYNTFNLLFIHPSELKNLIEAIDIKAFYEQLTRNGDDSLFK